MSSPAIDSDSGLGLDRSASRPPTTRPPRPHAQAQEALGRSSVFPWVSAHARSAAGGSNTVVRRQGRRGLGALALALTVSALSPAAADAGPVVAVLLVQAGSEVAATGRFTLDGHIEALRQATLASQIQGNVTRLAVKAGDAVRAGQLIARIDERETQAGLRRSEAALAQAEAEDRNARLHLDRTRELRAQGFVSQAALDQAETQWKATQAGVQQAQAGQAQAQIWRGHALLSAPFDGVVLATHIQAGDLASPGRPVATLYAPGALRAVAQVPASRTALARGATRIEVELPDGRRVTPTRGVELSTADPVTQTVEWRLDLPAAAVAGLHPGQTVRVHFAGASVAAASPVGPPTLRIPATAVLRRGELTAVYVVQGQGFSLRTVRLGPDRGEAGVEVVAGLRDGERIAVDALKAGLSGATPAAGAQP